MGFEPNIHNIQSLIFSAEALATSDLGERLIIETINVIFLTEEKKANYAVMTNPHLYRHSNKVKGHFQ